MAEIKNSSQFCWRTLTNPQGHAMIRQLNTFILMIAALLMGACTQKDPVIPKEGDVVAWMQNSSLIIKTKLGQRREHIPDRLDDLIYEPEYERFVGQFPIDYIPERFPKFTEAERVAFETEYAKKLHAIKSQHPIEFSLMLNGAKGKVTDEGLYSPKALDDINQVKVQLGYLRNGDNFTTKDEQERFFKYKEGRYDKQLSAEYGLECYLVKDLIRSELVVSYKCFGKSSYKSVSGAQFFISSGNWTLGDYWEPIYGGIHVEWRTHRRNLKHWKEIDAAIWRLLERWNVSPLSTQIKY
jgi:hypothetical protein